MVARRQRPADPRLRTEAELVSMEPQIHLFDIRELGLGRVPDCPASKARSACSKKQPSRSPGRSSVAACCTLVLAAHPGLGHCLVQSLHSPFASTGPLALDVAERASRDVLIAEAIDGAASRALRRGQLDDLSTRAAHGRCATQIACALKYAAELFRLPWSGVARDH